MSDNKPDLKFTHLSDSNNDLEFTNFRPNTLLNFNEVWQPSTQLEFDTTGGSDVKKDVSVFISASIAITASGSIDVGESPVGISVSGNIKVLASGLMTAEKPVIGIEVNGFYDLNATVIGTASYDSNVDRLARHEVSSDMQNSKIAAIDKQANFEQNELLSSDSKVNWQQSKLISTSNQSVFEQNDNIVTGSTLLSGQSKLVGTDSRQLYESQLFVSHNKQLSNESAERVSIGSWFGFEAMLKRQTERQIVYEGADWLGKYRSYKSDIAQVISSDFDVKREYAKVIYAASSERFIIVIPDRQDPDRPPEPDFNVSTILDFRCKWLNADTTLHFGFDCNPTQPQTGVIFVTNSVSLVRSDDGREIKMLGFSAGIDSNSYTWSFSATVPLSELSKVDTAREPRIGVDFECNGNLWRFILDSCDDSVSFGESSLTIKGKSRAMLLAHPYATQRGFKFDTAMSARQIAEAELNRNGVPSGFTLDWQLAGVNGWNVPANTYSYTGKTPINSLQWIAEAAGGFINADMSADILHVLAHYPIPSWEWAAQTPSINLTQSLITSRSRGRVNKPAYNGVTIYGENDNGIGALIKRTGTSGGYQPPMVTSDLMTDTAAAISRGKAILSDTGDIGNIGISMPLVSDVGVLKPSTLIGVNDGESWVGMVRGTTITGRLSSNRALEIDQSIDVERHFDKESV
ncbi:hypothetical protein [uncultured Psychrobacter sp.]|uniref:hypothetical protein n=1 Tax=uncultured Psychrobacter sp. TaxID=259303 RepID=UPI0030DB59C0|tara:strand:+ start:2593 stop:4659 length:2067 start_codon:yes stop_codon:yes gene_type:complete